MKVLILENSKLFQIILEELFHDLGLYVHMEDHGEKALQLLKCGEFDFVCVNMYLDDCTGIEFTKRYKAQERDNPIPIILITSESDESVLKECMEIGITEIYLKDNVEKLHKQIAMFVESFGGFNVFDVSSSRVLYIEDSSTMTLVTMEYLSKLKLNIDHFTSADEAYKNLEKQEYDLVITDIVVEGSMSILSLIQHLRLTENDNKNVPILAVTSFDDVPRKIELFKAGINDYTTKPILQEEFCARVTNLLSNKLLLDQVKQQKQELMKMAMTDHLTDLNNRNSLMLFVPKYIAAAKRAQTPLSIMMIDLDHFKSINDTHGHDVGDIVLKEVGKLLKNICRDDDFVARFGGEEFVVLLTNCDKEKAIAKSNNIRKLIESLNPNNRNITVSVGVTCMKSAAKLDFETLFKAADNALLEAKRNGRNQVLYQESVSS
ncbi:MAG: diguanylate cyclase [Candidatus Anammoxibacter sp.]